MIYIFTALYCEASGFIRQFHLKKTSNAFFQQFVSESPQILLTISGVGEIAAAAAVSSVCTSHPPGRDDFFINIGTCAGTAGQGELFLIHKLVEQPTGKTFYPDLLYRHDFQEAGLVTGMVPYTASDAGLSLYDMEAAAVYQAGAYFLGPHQMIFLKVVSDRGEGDRLSEERVRQLMEMHMDSICTFLERLLCQSQTMRAGQADGTLHPKQKWREGARMEQWLHQLCTDLHCSKTMEHSLRQHIRYAVLTEIDVQAVIEELYRENKLPCRDKREGKQRFEEFRQRLF